VRVLGFTGMPGAGKTIAADVARGLGIPVVRMGDCVWEEVRARGLPLVDEVVGGVAHEMRERFGAGIWAQRTLEKLQKLGAEKVAIDGVRSSAEVQVFRSALGQDFTLVALHASPRTRHHRLLARAREDEASSEEAAQARDRRELAWGIGEVIALADVVLVNEGRDEAAFRRAVELLLGAR
jgi:dephospho-CoA kinase